MSETPDPTPSDVDPGYRLWRHRDFLLFAVSRGASVGASQMLTVAVGWTLYVRTGNPLDLGLVGLARFLPVLLLFLWAGVVVDRYNRARIVGIANIAQAAAAGLIGLVLLAPDGAIWPVFLLLAVVGAAQAFLHPAQQAILPNIVPRPVWAQAVATTSTIIKAGQLGGPALAGLLIAVGGHTVFWVIVGLSALAGLCAGLIRIEQRVSVQDGSGWTLILGGFRHIWATPMVLGAITIDLIAVLFGGIVGLLPVFAIDILKVGPEALGVMRAMPAVGGLAMGLVLGALPAPRRTGALFFLSLAGFGGSVLVFGLSELFWLSLIALAVYGATDMFSVYVRLTLIQLGTPDSLRGRVNAVNSVSINATNELGDFRAGLMAAAIGPVAAVTVGAAVTLAATGLWWKLFPDLRKVDRM